MSGRGRINQLLCLVAVAFIFLLSVQSSSIHNISWSFDPKTLTVELGDRFNFTVTEYNNSEYADAKAATGDYPSVGDQLSFEIIAVDTTNSHHFTLEWTTLDFTVDSSLGARVTDTDSQLDWMGEPVIYPEWNRWMELMNSTYPYTNETIREPNYHSDVVYLYGIQNEHFYFNRIHTTIDARHLDIPISDPPNAPTSEFRLYAEYDLKLGVVNVYQYYQSGFLNGRSYIFNWRIERGTIFNSWNTLENHPVDAERDLATETTTATTRFKSVPIFIALFTFKRRKRDR